MAQIDTLVEYILLCHKKPVSFFFFSFSFCGSIFNWKKLNLSCLIQVVSCGYFHLSESRRIKKMEIQRNFHYFILFVWC